MRPNARVDDCDGYLAAENPQIQTEKLIHFALGIFWKSAVHSWRSDRRRPMIELGSYLESLRLFLRGEKGFPERMALTIGVIRPPVEQIAFNSPCPTMVRPYHKYNFYTSGISWGLSVGKAVDEQVRRNSFAPNPGRPIIVGNFGPGVREMIHMMFKWARRARNVEQYIKRKPVL
jgi:hypothetical protein